MLVPACWSPAIAQESAPTGPAVTATSALITVPITEPPPPATTALTDSTTTTPSTQAPPTSPAQAPTTAGVVPAPPTTFVPTTFVSTTRPPSTSTTVPFTGPTPPGAIPTEACAATRPPGVIAYPGSTFPGCRIVAYYGNPLSNRMGVLGEGTPTFMLTRLAQTTQAWRSADPTLTTICALELIVTTAQASPGRDRLYRARMKDALIATVLAWARSSGCVLILDVQVGRSKVSAEIPHLIPWLELADVHLALDPEWAMAADQVPGQVIGSMDATDVNGAVDLLARIVSERKIPPKILVVHRFTSTMLTNPRALRLDPRVQLLINMDGFGTPARKVGSYAVARAGTAVEHFGLKLFYKIDRPTMSPVEALSFNPRPVFINYQ